MNYILKRRKNKMIQLTGLALIIAIAVLYPFLLICGLNFLLEAAGFALLPYTIGTWFGALLVIGTLRGSNSK
jgi:hypothetical protein